LNIAFPSLAGKEGAKWRDFKRKLFSSYALGASLRACDRKDLKFFDVDVRYMVSRLLFIFSLFLGLVYPINVLAMP
jgi:hypothetical protein